MRQIVLMYLAVLALAPALMACSGPGASMAIARNNAIGFVGVIFGALIAIPVVWLRLRRLEENVRVFIPLLALVFNPRWFDFGGGGDCGMFLANAAYFYSFCWVALLVYEIVRAITHESVRKTKYARTGAMATAALILLAGAIYLIPWTLNPLPHQYGQLRYSPLEDIANVQRRYYEEHGVYAMSAEVLHSSAETRRGDGFSASIFDSHLENGDAITSDLYKHDHRAIMLQGTADNPKAWQVESGLSDWAVLARPNHYPEDGDWVQYLFMSDNTIWTKPDPGTGEYLLKGVPPDLAKDGWTKWRRE